MRSRKMWRTCLLETLGARSRLLSVVQGALSQRPLLPCLMPLVTYHPRLHTGSISRHHFLLRRHIPFLFLFLWEFSSLHRFFVIRCFVWCALRLSCNLRSYQGFIIVRTEVLPCIWHLRLYCFLLYRRANFLNSWIVVLLTQSEPTKIPLPQRSSRLAQNQCSAPEKE